MSGAISHIALWGTTIIFKLAFKAHFDVVNCLLVVGNLF